MVKLINNENTKLHSAILEYFFFANSALPEYVWKYSIIFGNTQDNCDTMFAILKFFLDNSSYRKSLNVNSKHEEKRTIGR